VGKWKFAFGFENEKIPDTQFPFEGIKKKKIYQ